MYFADQSGVLALIRLLLTLGESGHPLSLWMLPDFILWCLSKAFNNALFNIFYSMTPKAMGQLC